jgi:hypothetical protein
MDAFNTMENTAESRKTIKKLIELLDLFPLFIFSSIEEPTEESQIMLKPNHAD